MEYDIERHIIEFRINGFTVFEHLIDEQKIDTIVKAWTPVRDADIKVQGEFPDRGWGRYNVRVPFERPFVDPDIFEHPAVVTFLERVLGDDYAWSHFDSNIPLPGTDYQDWHRDGPASPFAHLMTPAFTIGCKFPLVDTSEENGSFEVIPCTQYVHSDCFDVPLNDLLGPNPRSNPNFYPIRLNLKKGSLWMHDGRVMHRGTPNRSDQPRDELCMGFCQSWVHNPWAASSDHDVPDELWAGLSEHARQVLRWLRVKD